MVLADFHLVGDGAGDVDGLVLRRAIVVAVVPGVLAGTVSVILGADAANGHGDKAKKSHGEDSIYRFHSCYLSKRDRC